jgi:hypothetical protein
MTELCLTPWSKVLVKLIVPRLSKNLPAFSINHKAPYTLSVKLSDFSVWRHTWRRNFVNCAVLTGNSAGLRTVLSSRLSQREMRSSLRQSHSFHSLPADLPKWLANSKWQPCFIQYSHTHKNTHRTDKADTPDGKPVLWQRTFSSVFRAVFFTQLNCTV